MILCKKQLLVCICMTVLMLVPVACMPSPACCFLSFLSRFFGSAAVVGAGSNGAASSSSSSSSSAYCAFCFRKALAAASCVRWLGAAIGGLPLLPDLPGNLSSSSWANCWVPLEAGRPPYITRLRRYEQMHQLHANGLACAALKCVCYEFSKHLRAGKIWF